MPRANRTYIPNHVWHITHRCHNREFLFKYRRDRDQWVNLLAQAVKKYGLCVLNYMVTSNHVHLIVFDSPTQGRNSIVRSLQRTQSLTGQTYNRRKKRKGAFWEDRYNATAVDSVTHLFRCLTYVDLNMVRAGVVSNPRQWSWSGFYELLCKKQIRGIIDTKQLLRLTGFESVDAHVSMRLQQIEAAIDENRLQRQPQWSEAIALGQKAFVESVKTNLGFRLPASKALMLQAAARDDSEEYLLGEGRGKYGQSSWTENEDNTSAWRISGAKSAD